MDIIHSGSNLLVFCCCCFRLFLSWASSHVTPPPRKEKKFKTEETHRQNGQINTVGRFLTDNK